MNYNKKYFLEAGFLGPLALYSKKNANIKLKKILEEINRPQSRVKTWNKATHLISKTILDIASDRRILKITKDLLGDNILLWGSEIIQQEPGAKHRWHRDVEHEEWAGITFWIGLDNLDKNSSISFITKSNQLIASPQHFLEDLNLMGSKDIIKKAKAINSDCMLVCFSPDVGEFFFWDGPMWHATLNTGNKIRTALILQFCSSSYLPRQPKTFDIPPQFYKQPVPSVLMNGKNINNKNWIINPQCLHSNNRFVSFAAFHYFNLRKKIYRLKQKILNNQDNLNYQKP